MLTDELFIYVFNGQPHILAQRMAAWLASSRRFTVFVSTFRDKIRKKLRDTQDPESLFDLQLEVVYASAHTAPFDCGRRCDNLCG